jgi:3-methyladenine DNA glycosylase AlkD
MGDRTRARDVQRYFRDEIVALGIAAPALRLLMRERIGPLRREWSPSEAIRLCDFLLREPEMEIRSAGILALAAFKRALTPGLLAQAESWLERQLDNWALVDTFCGSVLSPLLARHPEVQRVFVRWSCRKSLWPRRAALVALVPFARRGWHLDLAYRLCLDHLDDPEDLMHKATGWLLREAGKTDRARLKRFLLRHGPAIPRTALRYAIEHFAATERAQLLRATRAHGKGRSRGSP